MDAHFFPDKTTDWFDDTWNQKKTLRVGRVRREIQRL
jgi:hypothetical protein